jgi:exodeoxyribonuclease VII large subunit
MNIYSVSQINSYIKNMFTQDFMLQSAAVRGEVSNCKYHSSGHIYFTLKDSRGAMSCVMFAGNRNGLRFQMADGMQVVVTGTIDVYERDGKYQLYARQIVQDGTGILYERFERLKQELADQGIFDEIYKRPIPQYVRRLGVITAPAGAAVRDIIQISKRRNPYIQIILYPAVVQGVQAVPSIVSGFKAMEQMDVDVIIAGRGGGSIEDLWAFNEEAVARAIFDCPIPVISAVGHETDVTISDFAADLRAPTPSAAAELAVRESDQTDLELEECRQQLDRLMRDKMNAQRARVMQDQMRIGYLNPISRLREQRTYVISCRDRLDELMRNRADRARHRLEIDSGRLDGLSPLKRLSNGYTYTEDSSGHRIRRAADAKCGEKIVTRFIDGMVVSTVDETVTDK